MKVSALRLALLGLALLGLVLPGALLAGCGGQGGPEQAASGHPAGRQAVLPATPGGYLGVYERGTPYTYQPVEGFATATGRQPDIAAYYSGWPGPFSASFAGQAYRYNAVPLVQMQPSGISMAAVAAGRYDAYLASYAAAVRAYGHPVIISFCHEMNGPWYTWGWHHTSPAVWVAAWRHVVGVFRGQGARNVTWLWTVNESGPGIGPSRDWWPGGSYVTWVGIDGYYYGPWDTFGRVFGPAVAAVRKFTGKPILISEVAVGPGAGQAAKIPGLFAGIRAAHLLGLVWFDVAQHDGLYHQDWRLEDDPAGLAAFRNAARLMRPHGA